MARLPATPRPVAYDLDLEVDPRRDRFHGGLKLELEACTGARHVTLHAVDLDLDLSPGRALARDAAGETAVVRVARGPDREQVVLHLARPLRSERAHLELAWEGPLRTDLRGLYLARSGRRRYAATQLEAADARRFFPCFDEPDRKARFTLRVTTPERNAVVSNAPPLRTERHGRRKTVHFAPTPPLSTYLVALVVGELEHSRTRRCGRTPLRVWHVPGKGALTGFALEAAAAALERLERYFGLPYPYAKLDLIAVPDFEFGAMENAGAVTFRESLLLLDPGTASLAERKRVAEVIAHELAHMWYGDLVTMAWWDDLWLNEAFATWMAFRIVDEWRPEWRMWLEFEQHRAAAFSLDGLRNTHPVYTRVDTPAEATENFDAITYEKGASIVRMLERWLGPAAFRRGVRAYIRRHRESNARAADLWRALEATSGRSVEPLVRAWIERPGFPLVAVSRAERAGRARLELRQERFVADPRADAASRRGRWPIPLVARVVPPRGRTRLERGLLERERGALELGRADEIRAVYANAEESGFFRPLHDAELLGRLRAELGRLATVERMGLVGHQWAGLRAARAPLEDLLELVMALRGEPDAEVLDALLGPLGWLDDQARPALRKHAAERFWLWLAHGFGPGFLALGWKARRAEPDSLRLRRAALLRIAGGIARHAEIEAQAAERIRAYLEDRSAVDPNVATPLVAIAARSGDRFLYERYLRTMRAARTPQERTRFLHGLAAFREPALVQRTLELALGPLVPTQDVVPLLAAGLQNPDAREACWDFVRARWKELAPRIGPGLAPRLVQAMPALQTPLHRRQVAAFFRAHPLPTATRALRQALERFDLDAELRRRAAPALRRFLAALPAETLAAPEE